MRVLNRIAVMAAFAASACAESEDPVVPPQQGSSITTVDAGQFTGLDSAVGLPVPPATSSGIPCDVAAILEDKCTSCHGSPLNGAPMPLVKPSDFTAASLLDTTKTVAQAVKARIHDSQRPMPPLSSGETLSAAQLATLDAWLDKGAPASSASCQTSENKPDAGAEQVDLSECEFLNEPTAEDTSGYKPPLVDDHYECFYYEVPWDKDVHGFRFDPVIDDARAVHHWILYSIEEERPAGSHDANCGGKGRTFLAGWAPGQKGAVMPPDVGLIMPKASTHTLQLEVHYNNTARHEDISDNSGVRICASSKLRKNTAAVHIVGSTQINLEVKPGMQELVNGCKVASNMGPVTIMSASPHMHQLGRHMKTTVRRSDGTTETLVDVPFDFRDQTFYPKTMVVNKGDILTTTCTWENTSGKVVKQGEGTGDEMCFNFVTAYPAGALTGGISPLVSSTQNTCIGLGAEPFPILDI